MEPIAAFTLHRYIRSCNNEQHIATADRMITLFANLYGKGIRYTRLCMALQLKRIDLIAA